MQEELKNAILHSQLIDLTDEKMVVKTPKGFVLTFEFIEEDGDCCGYSEINNKLLYNKNDIKNNPIITDIKFEWHENNRDEDKLTITLFGVDKPIAEINSLSGSGSGWSYGAAVALQCKAINFDEILTEW